MKQQCVCAQTAYRNNLDGTRDYKVVGKSKCQICRGSGWVAKCNQCDGSGIFKLNMADLPVPYSDRCQKCDGNGKVRVEG